jgi:hypothetical protein
MAKHNYEDVGLPHGMELHDGHTHSDGHTQVDVNRFHGDGHVSTGGSEDQYADTRAADSGQSELSAREGMKTPNIPPSNTGSKVGPRH